MGLEPKLFASAGVVLGIVTLSAVLDIISLHPSLLKTAFVLMFGLVAILFGKTALSLARREEKTIYYAPARKGERILCYVPIALGIVSLVVWILLEW